MKRIIAEIHASSDGVLHNLLYCVDGNNEVDRSITETLLHFVEMSFPNESQIEQLLLLAESGGYVPKNPEWADWGVNDVDLWLRPPMAQPGHICISNENTSEFSTEEGGQPQQFTYAQFRAALKHWREFRALIAREGKDKLVGRRFEAMFPE